MLSSLLVWLKDRTVGTPWPRLRPGSPDKADEQLVLVLTRVVLDTTRRREFDHQNSRVLASMGSHPGLIGYAARRQLFGDQGWTMSVWSNDEARARFARSDVHRRAIVQSKPALLAVEIKRLSVARKDLPADWDQVLRMLAGREGRRNDCE